MSERNDLVARASALEAEAEALRLEAAWGKNWPYYKLASALVDEWCRDPDVWGTHGIPGEHKLERITRDIGRLVTSLGETQKPVPPSLHEAG